MLYDQRSRAELSFICENTLMPVMVLSCQWYTFKTLISSSNLDMRKLYENISRQILFIELSQVHQVRDRPQFSVSCSNKQSTSYLTGKGIKQQ